MDRLLEIGAGVSTPLGLAGLALVVLYLALRAVVRRSGVDASSHESGRLLNRAMNYTFVLALVAVGFGGVGFLVQNVGGNGATDEPAVGGTLRDAHGHLLKRTRLLLAGTDQTSLTNDLGWFRMPLPSVLAPVDSATLLVGDVEPLPAIRVAARTGLDLQLATVLPGTHEDEDGDADPTVAARDEDTPADADTGEDEADDTVQPPSGAGGRVVPVAIAEAPTDMVLDQERVRRVATHDTRFTTEMLARLRPLTGQQVRVVYPSRQAELAENAAERIRNQGGVPRLQSRSDRDTRLAGAIVHGPGQAAAARAVQEVLAEIAALTPRSTATDGDLVVYLPPGR